jgi:polyferredoxin/Flp pilus assembly protein TadD
MSCRPDAESAAPVRIPLQVLQPPKPPRTKVPRRRFWVLVAVNVFMLLHIVQWLAMGVTLAPIEPSEAMETAKQGLVTVGAVFFAVALLSTAILGRWFCGWGCHVVALQDGSLWLLKKFGIRPKPFRARYLTLVPLGLALYMFAWPPFYRVAIAPYVRPEVAWPATWNGFTAGPVLVEDFWHSFPGLLVAIPFLFACGFLCVYFLGAKGYCTYACPYGGFFAPLDEIAPGRIVVNDSCEGCGHCTAVCTSNVRVHEEVRDYGMVVDPGCMKCMDCVSTCPNEALSFALTRPAAARAVRQGRKPVARNYDLSRGEEIAFLAVGVGTLLAVRGAYGVIPLLFASGIAAIVTFLAWKSWRVLREPNVRFRNLQLTARGRHTKAGTAWVLGTLAIVMLVIHTGAIQASRAVAGVLDRGIELPPEVYLSSTPMEPDDSTRRRAETAIKLYGASYAIGDGGLALAPSYRRDNDLKIIRLRAVLGQHRRAEWMLRGVAARDGLDEGVAAGIARLVRAGGDEDAALAYYAETARANPAWEALADEWLLALRSAGRVDEAIDEARAAVVRRPDSLLLLRRASLILMEEGGPAEIEEGIRLTERTLEIEPANPFAWQALALGLEKLGRFDEAERALRRGLELAPDEWRIRQTLGQFLMAHDRAEEGAAELRRAVVEREAAAAANPRTR